MWSRTATPTSNTKRCIYLPRLLWSSQAIPIDGYTSWTKRIRANSDRYAPSICRQVWEIWKAAVRIEIFAMTVSPQWCACPDTLWPLHNTVTSMAKMSISSWNLEWSVLNRGIGAETRTGTILRSLEFQKELPRQEIKRGTSIEKSGRKVSTPPMDLFFGGNWRSFRKKLSAGWNIRWPNTFLWPHNVRC